MQCYPCGPQMSLIWRPLLTWVSPRIGVSLDTECFHFGAFYVSHGILWPEETFLWRQILGGVGRSCPPRNFGDTDWQRFTLTTGTGFGSRVILNKYVWVWVHEEMRLLREQVRGAVPTRYFGETLQTRLCPHQS